MAVEVTIMEQDGAQGHQMVPNSIGVHSQALWEMSLPGQFGPRFLRGLGILLIAAILWDRPFGRLPSLVTGTSARSRHSQAFLYTQNIWGL